MTYAHERTPTEWHTEYIQQHKHNLTMCRCTQWQLISTIVQSIVKDTLTQCSCTHLITRRFQIWAGYMDDFKIPLCQILTATFYVTSNLCDSNNAYLSTHTVYQYKIQFFHYLGHIGKWIQEITIFMRFCCFKLSKKIETPLNEQLRDAIAKCTLTGLGQ